MNMNHVTLADVMNRDFVGVSESDDIVAAARTMRNAGETAAVVLRGSEPVGVVTAADLLDHFVAEDENGSTIADVMVPSPESLRPEADIDDAAVALSRIDTDALLVANGAGVHGVVSARDLTTVPREPGDVEPAPTLIDTPEADEPTTEIEDPYSSQSICEACGGLARNLTNVNGQLLCAECKSM